jgi:effector-binding domain-containing protein/DNA-binding transcriptional MerR regulator
MDRNLVPIGRFSQVCRLSIKALRLYDELGLLRPAAVDPDSGYRYYSLAQAADAEVIHLLRALDMPLDEIGQVLRRRDPASVRSALEKHRLRMEARLAEAQSILSFLQRLLTEGENVVMSYEVKVRDLAPQPVVAVRSQCPTAGIQEAVGRSFGALFGYLGQEGIRPAGPPLIAYHSVDRDTGVDMEVCVPISEPATGRGDIVSCELPGGPVAYALHCGAYHEIGPAYQAVATWVQDNGREVAGPPREIYLNDPSAVGDPADLRTEIQFPLKP